MPDHPFHPRRAVALALVALAVASLLWGASFLIGTVALDELSPAHVILARFALGSICLAPFARRGRRTLRRSDFAQFGVAGFLLGPATMLLQFEGLARTTASRAALLMGTLPVLLTLAAVAFHGERIGWRGWAAVVVSALGAALLVGSPSGAGTTILGDALVLGSAAASVAWVLASRGRLVRHDAMTTAGLTLVTATVWLVPLTAWRAGMSVPDVSAAAYGSVVLLGVVCTAGTYGLWNVGLRYVSAARAAPFVNLEPLSGAALGVAVLGEPIRTGAIIGGALILGAAALAEWQSKRNPGPN